MRWNLFHLGIAEALFYTNFLKEVSCQSFLFKPGRVVHTCNPGTSAAKAGGSWIQGQSRIVELSEKQTKTATTTQ
jgi:hypothetical protein